MTQCSDLIPGLGGFLKCKTDNQCRNSVPKKLNQGDMWSKLHTIPQPQLLKWYTQKIQFLNKS